MPTDTETAVTDPDVEGIEFIDEEGVGENSIDRDEETKSEEDEDSDKETREDPRALHINRVNLSWGPRENERARLRVCVEIRHPALQLPVYRTWTGKSVPTIYFCSSIEAVMSQNPCRYWLIERWGDGNELPFCTFCFVLI